MDQPDDITVRVDADLSAFRADLTEATRMADRFGRSMTSALSSAVIRGRDLGDVLRGLALRLSDIAVKAALKPFETAISNTLGSAFAGLAGGVKPFASGGVVNGAAGFANPLGHLGVLGEAGPEAILPLARGPDGQLGVRAGEGGQRPVSVTVNITTNDAASFTAARGQVEGAIARAVRRGSRTL
ncbi:MAG: phage tail tape measure protein [Rhodobiaceae bacterium]|nr:phage tail tape measure protein [Rhodobiaceae bacterium]MCC0042291.1 phage tail tape measure protein [Rhodobiaceae bacterium]